MRRQSTQNYLKILLSVFFPQNLKPYFAFPDCIWELKKPKIHPPKKCKVQIHCGGTGLLERSKIDLYWNEMN